MSRQTAASSVILALLLLVTVFATRGRWLSASVMPTLACGNLSTTLTFSEGDYTPVTPTNVPYYMTPPRAPQGGTVLTNQFQPAGVHFSSTSPLSSWVYLATQPDPSSTTVASPGGGPLLSTIMLGSNPGNTTLTTIIRFVNPADGSAITAKGSGLSFWAYGRGAGPLTFASYDAAGTLIETKTVPAVSGSYTYGSVQFTTGNVARIEGVNTGLTHQGLAIDDLQYTLNLSCATSSSSATASCGEAQTLLSSIYTVVNGGTDAFTLNQNKTSVLCNSTDYLLSGQAEGPSCDTAANPACGKKMYYEFNASITQGPQGGTQHGWLANFRTDDDTIADTVRAEAVCVPNNTATNRYFSIYTRVVNAPTEYSQSTRAYAAMCDTGDIAISGGGASINCNNAGGPGCVTHALEYNGMILSGGKEGWQTSYEIAGDNLYDTIHTTVVCLKKTTIFDQYLRVYRKVNEASSTNYYDMNQNRTTVQCDAGDIAIGGGGNPPFCDELTRPACGKTEFLEKNRKTVSGNVQGWNVSYDLGDNATFDTQRVEVTCLGIANSCTGTTSTCSLARTINFETLPSGSTVNGSATLPGHGFPGTLISNQYQSAGVLFESNGNQAIATANSEAASTPNFLIGFSPSGVNDSFNPITMNLVTPTGGTSNLADRVDVTLISVGAAGVTARAYNTAGQVVSQVSRTGAGDGVNSKDPISLTGPGIVRVVFSRNDNANASDGFGIDDIAITFSTTCSSTAQCQDGVDNDGDGLTDHPLDLGCHSASDTDELNPTVDLKVNGQDGTITVAPGSTVTLTWTSTDALRCDTGTSPAPWGPFISKATSGTQQFTPTTSVSLGIQCAETLTSGMVAQDPNIAIVLTNGTCTEKLFDASKNTLPEQQGWTLSGGGGTVSGIQTEGSTKFITITDNSATGSKGYSTVLTKADLQDKNWKYEVVARVKTSNSTVPAGVNMLIVSDAEAYTSIYLDTGAYGPINQSVDYARKITASTTDGFHRYLIDYKKNGAGKADDTYDVYRDGQKVITNVVRTENYQATGSEATEPPFVLFGLATTSGQGSMDVSYARFYSEACGVSGGSSSEATCTLPEFYAEKGALASQGWIDFDPGPGTSVTGPFTTNGVSYIRLTDNSTERGLRTEFVGVTEANLADQNWTLEMKARVIASTPGAYVLGMNMLLTAAGGKNVSLYIDKTKFGVRGPLATGYEYGRTYSVDTTDGFHTYMIRYKKNGSGVNDDTFDVLFDGQVVIANVTRSEVHTWEAGQGINGISFGIGSSPGMGSMEVAHVKFVNQSGTMLCESSSSSSNGGVCTGVAVIDVGTPHVRATVESTATGTVITNQFLQSHGLSMTTETGVANKVVKINKKTFGFKTIDLTNIIEVSGSAPDASFTFSTNGKAATTDLLSLRFLLFASGSTTPQLRVTAYDYSGNVMETVTKSGGPQYVSFSEVGEVARIRIQNLNGSAFYFTDISYAPLICAGMTRLNLSSSSRGGTTSSPVITSSSPPSTSAAVTTSSARPPSTTSAAVSTSSARATTTSAAVTTSSPEPPTPSSDTSVSSQSSEGEASSSDYTPDNLPSVLSQQNTDGSCPGTVCMSGGNVVCSSFSLFCIERAEWPCYTCIDENLLPAAPGDNGSASSEASSSLGLVLTISAPSSARFIGFPSIEQQSSASSPSETLVAGISQSPIILTPLYPGASNSQYPGTLNPLAAATLSADAPVPATGPAAIAMMAAGASAGVAWIRRKRRS